MTPQTVNAYYNPTTNEICFLSPPVFQIAVLIVLASLVVKAVRHFMTDYHSDSTIVEGIVRIHVKRFDERAQVMVNVFDSIEVAPGVYGNGRMTLGENIADHGGLQVAYQAFKKATAANPLPVMNGLTPEQRFFLAYAGVWGNNIRPEEVLNRTKSDVHSLGKWRVNGALPQIGAWYEAFNITENDPMFVPVDKRVSIW